MCRRDLFVPVLLASVLLGWSAVLAEGLEADGLTDREIRAQGALAVSRALGGFAAARVPVSEPPKVYVTSRLAPFLADGVASQSRILTRQLADVEVRLPARMLGADVGSTIQPGPTLRNVSTQRFSTGTFPSAGAVRAGGATAPPEAQPLPEPTIWNVTGVPAWAVSSSVTALSDGYPTAVRTPRLVPGSGRHGWSVIAIDPGPVARRLLWAGAVAQAIAECIDRGEGDFIAFGNILLAMGAPWLAQAGVGAQATFISALQTEVNKFTMRRFDEGWAYQNLSFAESNIGLYQLTGDPRYMRKAILQSRPRVTHAQVSGWKKKGMLLVKPIEGSARGLTKQLQDSWAVTVEKLPFRPKARNPITRAGDWLRWKFSNSGYVRHSQFTKVIDGAQWHAAIHQVGPKCGYEPGQTEIRQTISVRNLRQTEVFVAGER